MFSTQELCGSTEPLQCFSLKRSAAIRRCLQQLEARPGDLDGAVAVYAILAAVARGEASRPLLKPGDWGTLGDLLWILGDFYRMYSQNGRRWAIILTHIDMMSVMEKTCLNVVR